MGLSSSEVGRLHFEVRLHNPAGREGAQETRDHHPSGVRNTGLALNHRSLQGSSPAVSGVGSSSAPLVPRTRM